MRRSEKISNKPNNNKFPTPAEKCMGKDIDPTLSNMSYGFKKKKITSKVKSNEKIYFSLTRYVIDLYLWKKKTRRSYIIIQLSKNRIHHVKPVETVLFPSTSLIYSPTFSLSPSSSL